MIVTQDPVKLNGVSAVRVEDSRKILALLAGRFYGNPSRDIHLVGITGTNGKTTVAFLLESIFIHAGINCGLLGTMLYRWPGYETVAERKVVLSDLKNWLESRIPHNAGTTFTD